ncbi:NAD-binding protein [Fomitiporia mediterranea MF3/22]|uniref:NAD-binding protein n=1 Tax=Fomitiporia mediterranea (strain MF3/22) TaxID=694068 RepID=UPI000440755D|nr:NAD-binding protein [Fomitiporia mediterranea MF3/22]EJD07537.1 NAD-binding protein [Fomitiporia mediterranea MF3/22]
MSNIHLKMDKLSDLTGKVALITGGGTGIGFMMAKGLAANGAKVYITGRRFEVLQKAAEQNLQMDVTVKESILSIVQKIKESDGKLDVLINNAATDGPRLRTSFNSEDASQNQSISAYGRELFDIQSFEDWGSLAQTNVASYFFVTMAFLDLLVETSIINITSGAGQTKLPFGYYAYASLKAGTAHLTRLLATDLALKRAPIRVNAIAPGVFPSQLNHCSLEELEEYTKTPMVCLQPIPLRRPGREHEIASLAVYLASPASSYLHGQEINIDGGLLIVNP